MFTLETKRQLHFWYKLEKMNSSLMSLQQSNIQNISIEK